MNANLDAYLSEVVDMNQRALRDGAVTLVESIPCIVCRELEPVSNQFVDSSDPFMVSYRSLRRFQRLERPLIPRKIEFESAVYLKEGIIDSIFPNSDVTILFVGDGNSDKRFVYNCYRLLNTFGTRFRIRSFICNSELLGKPFGSLASVAPGWNRTDNVDNLFYHALTWSELGGFLDAVQNDTDLRRALLVIDLDGTYLCPRPDYNTIIKDARRQAIVELSDAKFDDALFQASSEEDRRRMQEAYKSAQETAFSRVYDDEDLTMLIALGVYAGVIEADDILLNTGRNVGFSEPIEWLQFASFLIENQSKFEYRLRQLRSLYIECANTLQEGAPSAFLEFRQKEEEILRQMAEREEVRLNRHVTQFIVDAAKAGAAPIAFTDRPNASLGLQRTNTPAHTVRPRPDALITAPLRFAT